MTLARSALCALSPKGGAITIDSVASLSLISTDFVDNTCLGFGGAMRIWLVDNYFADSCLWCAALFGEGQRGGGARRNGG